MISSVLAFVFSIETVAIVAEITAQMITVTRQSLNLIELINFISSSLFAKKRRIIHASSFYHMLFKQALVLFSFIIRKNLSYNNLNTILEIIMEKLTPFKEMSKQDKIAYIWDYWKWPIIATVLIIMLVSSVVKTVTTHKDPNLAVLMINSHSKDVATFEEIVATFQEENYILLNANLGFSEQGNPIGFYLDDTVLSAELNSETFDLFFGNGEKYNFCADEGFLIDLRNILSPDILNSIPDDHILYSTVGDRVDPYPCAILFDRCPKLEAYYPDEAFYCGIIYNSPNLEAAGKALENLLIK